MRQIFSETESIPIGPIDFKYEILFSDDIDDVQELTIPVNSFPELVATIAHIKQIGGIYVGYGDLPKRLWRVEIAIYPRLKTIRGIVMLDDEELDQRGEVQNS